MKTNNIKDIWKTGTEEHIKSYSEKELNEIVVKSARESIKAIYPGAIFRLVILAVIAYLIIKLFSKEQPIEEVLIYTIALVLLFVSYFFYERAFYKIRRYTCGKPVKEWLEGRIKEIEKSIRFKSKYDRVIHTCSFLFALGFYVLHSIIANINFNIVTVLIIPLGIIIYLLIMRHSLNRNYQRSLRELKDLYKQFEDPTE